MILAGFAVALSYSFFVILRGDREDVGDRSTVQKRLHEEQLYLRNLRTELRSGTYSETSKVYLLGEIATCRRRIAKLRRDLQLPPEETGDDRRGASN